MKKLFHLRTVISKTYVVSTIDLSNNGRRSLFGSRRYETMVFPCDSEGKITDWLELDVGTHSTIDEATAGHLEMVQKFSDKINNI